MSDSSTKAIGQEQTAREPCEWTDNPTINQRVCLHKGCEKMITYGEWVLFFPKKARAMCRTCGEMYLEIAV